MFGRIKAFRIFLPLNRVILVQTTRILRSASDGCRSRPWLAYSRVSGPSHCRCFQTLTVLFQFIFRVDGHMHRRTFAKRNISVYWLWLLLDVSAVSVVIVIIAICDMPRQEFSLCEHVYIHNTCYAYEKQNVLFWNTTQISSQVSRMTCA